MKPGTPGPADYAPSAPPAPSASHTTPASAAPAASDASAAGRALEDALYYLRHGCEPCADRHFQRARRQGATTGQVAAVRALAAGGEASGQRRTKQLRDDP